MNHPILVAALAEDRRRRCPCGAVAQQPYGLCRECQAAAVWRCETTRTSRRGAPSWTRAGTSKARLFARVASLLQIIGKGAGELMLTALILVVFAAVALVLILLAVVVVAIRQEPRDAELSNVAPSLIAVMVRRLLGVYVRRPTPPADSLTDKGMVNQHVDRATARSRPPGGRR